MTAARSRPRCAVFIAVTVDGYIAREGGGLDFLDPMMREGEDYGYAAFSATVDALVMGRKTFDTVLGFDAWPYAGKRVVVLTHRPQGSRHGEEYSAEAPATLVERLAREGVRKVYVDGGQVVGQFLAAGLIDELTVSVVPVLLGTGVPLFAPGGPERKLTLLDSRAFPSGLVQTRYRVEDAEPIANGA